MKKATVALILAVAGTALGTLVPASAHDAEINIVGFQYLWNDDELVPGGGTAGYLNSPAGPTEIGGAVGGDSVFAVTNRDPVPHTLTQCTAGCDTDSPSAEGAAFDVVLQPGESKPTTIVGTYIAFCRFHTWMRANIGS